MPRKKDDFIEQQLAEVISSITDAQTMTWTDLLIVAQRWCMKDYQHHINFAIERGVIPAALILAALLYVEHPLLVAPGRGFKYGFLRATAEIMLSELREEDQPIPTGANSFHTLPVERNR